MVALDDAEIETGKGGDYFSPSRVEYCAFDDLPEIGVLDDKFFDRYSLNEDLTISPVPAPAIEEKTVQSPAQNSTPVIKTVAGLPWRQRLLVHIWNDEYSYNVDQEVVNQAYSRELDTDDKYSQNLILACDHNELKTMSDYNLWIAMSAVRDVFPLSGPAPLLSDVCAFVKKYIETEYVDRKLMIKAWKEGNRDFVVKRTPSGATAGGNNRTDRGEGFNHTKETLAVEVALGVLGRSMDFDIYSTPVSIVNRAREMVDKKEKPFIDWFDAYRNIPGGLDYSRAIVIYSVKCAPEDQPLAPGKLMHYLAKTLTETDHEHPAPEIVAAACGMTPGEMAQPETSASAEVPSTTPLVLDLSQKIAVAMYDPSITPDEVTAETLEAAMLELSRKEPAFVRAQKALMYLADTLNEYSSGEIFTAVRAVDFNTLQGSVIYRRTALQALGETVVFDEEETSEDEEEQAQNSATGGVDDAGSEGQAVVTPAADACKPAEEVKPGRTIFSVAELLNAPAAAPVDSRKELSARQVEICIAINELLSGRTGVIGKDDIDEFTSTIDHPLCDLVPLLIADIESAEALISPEFSDEEIHSVTTTILERWSEDVAKRQKTALDDIVLWRKEVLELEKEKAKEKALVPVAVDLPPPAVEPATPSALTFKQQLLLAAVQGLCANPAYATSFDDISSMARAVAESLATDEE
ncbi:Exodeoxyribonuclease 8 [Beauveria bassiana D1-5]|uniref:Exodeoxyribonuclease 8 n=1 Tax=Beauveria bassiana D1-5 TaxID=1245745 RepID=A0A0A2V8U2_BEABA|nr:Exodeoxyribonuclease 8 [Beauveria bassiana D1-5]